MKVLKTLSIASGIGALALAATLFQTAGAQQQSAPSVQTQTPTRTAQTPQRRTTRSYSYAPNRGLEPGPNTPTWKRADSKVKFRYGTYPY